MIVKIHSFAVYCNYVLAPMVIFQRRGVNLTDIEHHVDKCTTALERMKGGNGEEIKGLGDYVSNLTGIDKVEYSDELMEGPNGFIAKVSNLNMQRCHQPLTS